MRKFTVHKGLVAPMDRENVDTDAIIPKQFLKSIRKTGFGQNLFDEWRYLDPGYPGQDPATRKPNPDFVLNQPRYKGASILLARKNFGCGSSREHAPWALQQYGFRALIAPSFADIFASNAFKNGIVTVALPQAAVDRLLEVALEHPLSIDLDTMTVTSPLQDRFEFWLDPFRRDCLIGGLDEIALTLASEAAIRAYEQRTGI